MPNAATVTARALAEELEAFEAAAERIERIAVAGLHGPSPVQGRERTFVEALLRHAKGAHVAAAAWRNDRRHG